jgi:hypothetical protein
MLREDNAMAFDGTVIGDVMGDLINIDALAEAIAKKLARNAQPPARRWPEVMNVETAAEYMDRSPDAIRHLVRLKVLPATKIDHRLQLRRVDIDRVAERNSA